MVRKTAKIGTAYLAGLFFASFFENPVFIFVAAALFVAGIAAYYLGKHNKIWAVVSAAFLVGNLLYFGYAKAVYEPVVRLDRTEITFSGRIISCEYIESDKASYIASGKINGTRNAKILIYGDYSDAEFGDKIEFSGKAERLENTYLFDAEDYYKSKNVFITCDKIKGLNIKKSADFAAIKTILNYRYHISETIRAGADKPESELLCAMLTGDTSGLSEYEKCTLYRAGAGHLTAVSGTHLSIFAAMLGILFIPLRKRGLKFALIQLFLIGFVVFAGASESVLRAYVMLTIVLLGGVFRRESDCLTSLCIAGILLTVFTPFAVRDPSFLLSAAGVLGFGVAAPYFTAEFDDETALGALAKDFVSMLCVSLCVFPLSLLFFDEVSLAAPFTNLLLMPLGTAALICGFGIALSGGVLAAPLTYAGAAVCKLMLDICAFVSELKFTYLTVKSFSQMLVLIIASVGIILGYIFFRKRRVVLLCTAAALICFFGYSSACAIKDEDTVNIAAIGSESACCLIASQDENAVVIDINGSEKTASCAEKYLSSKGIKTVDALVFYGYNPSQTAAYSEKISKFRVNSVYVCGEEYYGGEKLMGIAPKTAEPENMLILRGFSVEFDEESAICEYAGRRVQLNLSGKKTTKNCDVIIKTIGETENGELSLADTDSGYCVKITKDGRLFERRLN